MNIDLIFKIAGTGIIITVICQILKKSDREKPNNQINRLLNKANVNDIIKYLEYNILYEIINFNYVSLILDLVYFNKNTRNFWGTDYYKVVNSIQEDEE